MDLPDGPSDRERWRLAGDGDRAALPGSRAELSANIGSIAAAFAIAPAQVSASSGTGTVTIRVPAGTA